MSAHEDPARLVETLRAIFGHHRARAAHAKGVLLEGTFKPTLEARELCAASLFAGAMLHVTVRFSDSTGLPDIADGDPAANPRGFAAKLHLLDGSDADVVAHGFNGFPAATVGEFGAFLRAVAASAPGVASPTALERFLAEHPAAKTFLTTQKPAPVSWATLTYYGVNAFRFVDGQGRATPVRYRFVPRAGEHFLDAATLATKRPNYLTDEITARVDAGPVLFDWFAQQAAPDDVLDDPSTPWPETRTLSLLGTFNLVRKAFDQTAEQRAMTFSPGNVPAGIEPADPMVAVRDAAYAVSVRERQ